MRGFVPIPPLNAHARGECHSRQGDALNLRMEPTGLPSTIQQSWQLLNRRQLLASKMGPRPICRMKGEWASHLH